MAEINILVAEDDLASQNALKSLLDSGGWRVHAVSSAAEVLKELARGVWNLAIVNAGLTDPAGPVFAILRELAQADLERDTDTPASDESDLKQGLTGEPLPEATPGPRQLRVLYLLPPEVAKEVQPILERDALPYAAKPYNLHDLLEKVSDLLLEAGAIDAPIRTIREFAPRGRPSSRRVRRENRSGAMFAPREDYQMTEEEMAEWERQEEEERKKRRKEQQEREHLG
jgi:CheY-like chemotaxis protein